jgi:hypothetical protein
LQGGLAWIPCSDSNAYTIACKEPSATCTDAWTAADDKRDFFLCHDSDLVKENERSMAERCTAGKSGPAGTGGRVRRRHFRKENARFACKPDAQELSWDDNFGTGTGYRETVPKAAFI